MTQRYSRNWVRDDGVPTAFAIEFEPTEATPGDDPGPEISLPDAAGWWVMSTYSGVLPPAVAKKVDKILAKAPTTTSQATIPGATRWDQPQVIDIVAPSPSGSDLQLIATTILQAAREDDDPTFHEVAEALTELWVEHPANAEVV